MLKNLVSLVPVFVAAGVSVLIAGYYARFWALEIIVSQAPLLTVSVLVMLGSILLAGYASRRRSGLIRLLCSSIAVGWIAAMALIAGSVVHIYTRIEPPVLVRASDNGSLRFSTYNKLFTNSDLESAADIFGQQGVDIVSLQEVTRSDVTYYQEALGFDYSAVTSTGHSAYGSEVGVVSRYPLLSVQTAGVGGSTYVLRTEVDLPQGIVVVYTAHIKPPITPGANSNSQQALDGLALMMAEEQAPVLLAGDFNMTIFSPKFQGFLGSIGSDHRLATLKSNPECSWYGSLMGVPLCMRIDHVFYDAMFGLIDVQVSGDVGSDHRIITANLSL